MTYRLTVLAVAAIAGCAPARDDLPVQEPGPVVVGFISALRACSAGLTPEGSIDQNAMAATGWQVISRQTRFEQQDRDLAVNAFPALRPQEYEATRWTRPGATSPIELVRWDTGTDGFDMLDKCVVGARVADDGATGQVIAAMTRVFGRPPDRHGLIPRGGDFLTPRFDPQSTGDYWALPRHDVYILSSDGYLSLEVVAMPDRSRLDQYSSDRPEHRIPT